MLSMGKSTNFRLVIFPTAKASLLAKEKFSTFTASCHYKVNLWVSPGPGMSRVHMVVMELNVEVNVI
jgi:hypothetical protein